MNREEFGKLLAALRKNRLDENYHKLTQRKLAHITGISEQVIGNIERGDKASLESGLLLELARALRLSTRERREFFLAAIGVDDKDVPANQPEPLQIFEELFESLAKIALPAFIVDSYDDIVAANHIILKLFGFSDQLREIAPHVVGGYNVIRFVFSKRSQFRNTLTIDHEKYLMQSVRFFRSISLPYRATPYYKYLVSAFMKDRDMTLFKQYYHIEADASDQIDYYFEGERFSLSHDTFGELAFYSPAIFPVSTSPGSLYLITYIPASISSIQACTFFAQEYGLGAIRLCSWPEKVMPYNIQPSI